MGWWVRRGMGWIENKVAAMQRKTTKDKSGEIKGPPLLVHVMCTHFSG